MAKVYYEPKRTKGPNDPDRLETGEIPQVAETYAYPQRRLPDHERAPAGHRRDDDRRPPRAHERERHHRRARALPPRPRAGEDGPRGHPRRRRADQGLRLQRLGRVLHLRRSRRRSGISRSTARARARRAPSGPPSASPTTRSASRPTPAASARSTWPNADFFMASANVDVPGRGDGLLVEGERQALRFHLRLQSRFADQPLLPAPRVAGPEPARAVAQAQPQLRELSRSRSSPTRRSASPTSWPSSATPTTGPPTT